MFLEEIRPDIYVEKFENIPFSELWKKGICGYVVDFDNTIYEKEVGLNKNAVNSLKKAVKKGYIKNLVILTNTIFGKKRIGKVEKFAKELSDEIEIPVKTICLNFFVRKPSPYGFIKTLDELKCRTVEVAVIGDQLLSDIRGGNRLRFFTILVDPLGPYSWMSVVSLKVWRNIRAHRKLELKYDS